MLNITQMEQLTLSSKIGASWEGFALEQVIHHHRAEIEDCFFWATHADAELDLLITQNNKKLGFEFKYTSTPKVTKSMHSALTSLNLDKITIVIPGEANYRIHDKIEVYGLNHLV